MKEIAGVFVAVLALVLLIGFAYIVEHGGSRPIKRDLRDKQKEDKGGDAECL